MNTIKEAWEDFERQTLEPEDSADFKLAMKCAFYAGATVAATYATNTSSALLRETNIFAMTYN